MYRFACNAYLVMHVNKTVIIWHSSTNPLTSPEAPAEGNAQWVALSIRESCRGFGQGLAKDMEGFRQLSTEV